MCPLRLLLVFLSATLAGYFAWRLVRSPSTDPVADDPPLDEHYQEGLKKRGNFDAGKMLVDGFWAFVDMASGRYLWRAMKDR